MQHSMATFFLLALMFHLLPIYALPANEHQSSSLNPYNLDLDLPFIAQSDPDNPTFPLLTVDAQTAKSHLGLPPAVKLVNNTCTPFQPIFNSSKATLQLSTGLEDYNSSHDSMGTLQFDIFSSTNCSNGSLIETVWPKGDTFFTRITREQEPRMYHMKSVRIRTKKGETEEATSASWNQTAIYCHDEKMPCVRRNETSNNAPHLPKRDDTDGQMGQYRTTDCSSTLITDMDFYQHHGFPPDLPIGYAIISSAPYLYEGECNAWFPVYNQSEGPSVGISFGTGLQQTQALQIFKSNVQCASDLDTGFGLESCCDAEFGGLLGTIYKNGTADFGADYNLGPKNGACMRLGPGFDQTLWQMRFYKAIWQFGERSKLST